jgi:hypothetical protein
LVLRAECLDSKTTATEQELADDIFGGNGDMLNLKSQFSACSDSKLTFVPLTTNPLVGTDGVYTVKLPKIGVNGVNDGALLAEITNAASTTLGVKLDSVADHVMVCLPPGTAGTWVSYGYYNSFLSVYNDNWCRYPSAQMHELGKYMLII